MDLKRAVFRREEQQLLVYFEVGVETEKSLNFLLLVWYLTWLIDEKLTIFLFYDLLF